MDEKLYGVKSSIVKELHTFQLKLRSEKAKMPLIDIASVSFGDDPPELLRVVATENKVAIGDWATFFITRNTQITTIGNKVILIKGNLKVSIDLENSSADSFVAALGSLDETSLLSSDESKVKTFDKVDSYGHAMMVDSIDSMSQLYPNLF